MKHSNRIRVIGVAFDHMHIGDQLRLAADHPEVELVGVFDTRNDRMGPVLADLGLDVPAETDLDRLIERTAPSVALVCSTTADHVSLVERLAAAGIHVLLEKPFGDSSEAVSRMIAAAERHQVKVLVNWPLAWYPAHRTTHRLVEDGVIGEVQQIHFYDGNRGPLRHVHAKGERAEEAGDRLNSWWYSRSAGGGSLRDYLGYGVTLGLWFKGEERPLSVTSSWHIPDGLEVDEQSVTVVRFPSGLSVFETRWGTQSDPWTQQPQPRCGFVINGSLGSITSWDFGESVSLQIGSSPSVDVPVDSLDEADKNALANLVAHLLHGRPLDGPMTAHLSSRGHELVEAAFASAISGVSVMLDGAFAP